MSGFFESLHAPSILFAGGLIGLFGTLSLARSRGFCASVTGLPVRGVWLAAALLQTLVSFANALRPVLDSWVVFGPLNALLLAALSCLWLGARRLLGSRDPVWWVVLPPLAWIALAAIPGFVDNSQLRVGVIVPLVSAILMGSAVEMVVLHRRDGIRSALELAAMLGLIVVWLCILLGARLTGAAPSPGNWGFFSSATALLMALFSATLPLLMLGIGRELQLLGEAEKRAAALAEGRAEITRLHEGLPAVIFLRSVEADGSSRILYRGGDVAGVTGLPLVDMRADGLPVRVPHSQIAPLREHRLQTLRDGAASLVWHMPQPDGGRRVLRTSSRLLRRLPGGGGEVVGHTIDITTECEAEARALAAARLAAVGEMGKGLAHEIKQPLQAISLAAELLSMAAQKREAGAVATRLDTIIEQAARAAEVVEHLRRFSSQVDDAASMLPIDLAAAVKAALRLTWHALDEAGVTVELALGDDVPRVMGHEVGLAQALVHLITNARDAMQALPQGAARRLLIGAAAVRPGRVALTIADTGGGIDAAVLPRLFVPFVTTKGPDRGQGIGLAATHGLVRAMRGSIEARNAAEGALFVINLVAVDGDAAAPRATLD